VVLKKSLNPEIIISESFSNDCFMAKNKKLTMEGAEITVLSQDADDHISMTDMASGQMQDVVIIKWLSLKSTIEILGEWGSFYNWGFNYGEFRTIKSRF